MKILSEITDETDVVPSEEPVKQQNEFELPPELLQMIISQLNLRDNIRASVVCKSWLDAAITVRVADKAPLLLIFPILGDLYELYDPSERKSILLDFPELRGSHVCYSKDGWLLLYKPNTKLVFFFSPYTRELINLPDMDLTTQAVAFSAPPTSPNCVVFTVKNIIDHDLVALITWRPGETVWTVMRCRIRCPFACNISNKIVFCNNLFYCLDNDGMLGFYNPETASWASKGCIQLPNLLDNFFLAVHKGDIYIIVMVSSEDPEILKVEFSEGHVLYGIKTFGGTSFFVNRSSFLARADLLGTMRNKVYFPKVISDEKHCVSYSVDEGRYYPQNELYKWGEQDLIRSVWIEPPESLSHFC